MREIIFAGQNCNNLCSIEFAKFNKKDKEPKRNLIKGATYLGGSGYVGQQAIRSGIPRLLGVRLESHSTSRKNAKEILKNGGWLDPNKGGAGITKDLVVTVNPKHTRGFGKNQFAESQEFINRAKGNVYITGKHSDSDNSTNNVVKKLRKFWKTPVGEQIYKKGQRAFYRGQSEVILNKEVIENSIKKWRKSSEIQEKLINAKKEIKLDIQKLKNLSKKKLVNSKDDSNFLIKNRIRHNQETIKNINSGVDKRREFTENAISKNKGKSLREGLLGKGRSLYIGGSDEYFTKNFIPDPDDALAMKANKKIKVSGNRGSATLDALKREGNGSRLKGIAKLVKANPSRVLAGAGILAGGGLLTAKLGQSAYKNLTAPSDGKVKGFSRKNKSGKWSNVKSFIRDKIKK